MFLPPGAPFAIEMIVTDTNKNKRRLNFTSNVKTVDKNYFHAKIPVDYFKRGIWMNMSFDLLNLFELFKGQTFRSLDGFTISGIFKLRKIFTMKNPLNCISSDDEFESPTFTEGQLVPKTQNFQAGISYTNQLINQEVISKYLIDNTDNPEANALIEESGAFTGSLNDIMKIKGIGA
mmetsp:Transcript_39044/g.34728  ORF Transcript_39044/g.34728 Transcript_39044/m.34728 type:complete len:177 (+) Transcript_39044:1-531(+)